MTRSTRKWGEERSGDVGPGGEGHRGGLLRGDEAEGAAVDAVYRSGGVLHGGGGGGRLDGG